MIALIYALAIGIIITLSRPRKPVSTPSLSETNTSPTLGELRRKVEDIQQDMQDLRLQVWDYGSAEEDRSRRWRIACLAVAGKSISVLQSCWVRRNEDKVTHAIYNQLLTRLESVGLETIEPRPGDEIDPDDRAYVISDTKGRPPYTVSRVLYPGYYLSPEAYGLPEQEEKVLLEPAVIEVVGEDLNTEAEGR